MSNQRRLGRGLEALLGRSLDGGAYGAPAAEGALPLAGGSESANGVGGEATSATSPDVTVSPDGQQWLPVGLIDRNPYQPRQAFDEAEIADLCDSIRMHGFLQPIVVRRLHSGYQLIAGERRLRAAQMAAWDRVPVLIREVTDREMAELAIVENVQRKDLNPIEKAHSFHRYMQEYNCTHEDVAARINVDRTTVTNLVRLLDLPGEVKHMVSRGELSASHARALLPLGEEKEMVDFAWRTIKEATSVRGLEQAVAAFIRQEDGEGLSVVDREGNSRPAPMQPGHHVRELEEQLKLALGTKVEIKQGSRGRGRITLHFTSHEEFDRLHALLREAAAGPARAGGRAADPADYSEQEFTSSSDGGLPGSDFGSTMAFG